MVCAEISTSSMTSFWPSGVSARSRVIGKLPCTLSRGLARAATCLPRPAPLALPLVPKRYPCPRRKRQTTSRLRRRRMPSGTPFSAKSADTSPGPAWCVRTIPEYAFGIAEVCVAWHRLSTRKTYRLLWRRNAQQRVARRRTTASSSSPRATSPYPPLVPNSSVY